ncbi:histone H4 transcription factor-like [Dermatophagoides pteronyssinus]|uniref:histone H4 transcription factor-like n=1 Tax=Dermatophagoides pteronyssinus TaxID=6956 RepID=UPI003F66420D
MSINSTKSMIVIGNLPNDINIDEIRSFLSTIDIQIIRNGGVRIIPSNVSNEQIKMNAYVCVESEDDVQKALQKSDKILFRNHYTLTISRTTQKEMEKELRYNIPKYIRKNIEMTCEWIDCNQKFHDRSLYLQHINQIHVPTYWSNIDDKQKCKWQGCYEDNEYIDIGHFQLHLSLHGFHNQLMNVGQQIMNITIPRLICYIKNPSRNVIIETYQQFICGWRDCNAEFIDAETFFQHVEYHAIEDVTIPMISKEKLKKVRFARCQWLNCQASFKKKSHLKMHLNSHTQRKSAACPICGEVFATRIAFINHCYRQETPTGFTNQPSSSSSVICNNNGDKFVNVDCMEDDDERILTIDEDVNHQSSIVIRLPHNINLKTTSTTTNGSTTTSSLIDNNDKTNESILLVNFANNNNNNQQQQQINHQSDNNNDDDKIITTNQSNNVIQLQFESTSSTNQISNESIKNSEREFQCNYCTKSFHTASLLREHENKHTKKHSCPYCSYSAFHRSHLKEHILFRHSNTYDFQCQFCQQPFKTRRFLQRHIESHKKEKKNQCQNCGQKFTSFFVLNRHYRMKHLNEQIIFACHLCTKQYNRGNNLSRHLIKIHQLKVAKGWKGFSYVKQSTTTTTTTSDTNSSDIYHINPLSYTQ